jgi:hypothetical protein
MARHAEVKEKEIINAGLILEQKGKLPNPGSIRAQLGFRGGLSRIRRVWESYLEKRGDLASEEQSDLRMEDLPSEISHAFQYLIANQKQTLEGIVLQMYQRCQALFEKRLDEHVKNYELRLQYMKECEISADESIQRLEEEINSLQAESKDLASQNARLIVENAEAKGKLIAYQRPIIDSNK